MFDNLYHQFYYYYLLTAQLIKNILMHNPYINRFPQSASQKNFYKHNQNNNDSSRNALSIQDFIKNYQNFKPQKKKIDKYMFAFDDFVGKGNFAKVYKGINTHSNETVAIKVMEMKNIAQKKLYCLLQAEMEIFKTLRHSNILKCYDVLITDNNCYVISQFCEQGDLESYFHKNKNANTPDINNQKQILSIIYDVYQGLLYLQRKGIIHRDIKMPNILIKDGTAKIADFGFAAFGKNNFQDVTVGSPVYMSPQALINHIYGPKTDIWAFGILLYEIFHGKTPFDHCKSTSELIENIKTPFANQKIDENLEQKLKNLIKKCLTINQEERPSFRQLWMDQYIWQLRNKFKPILKQSKFNYVSNITSTTMCCTEIQSEVIQKLKKVNQKKSLQQQMEEFYTKAEQMNRIYEEQNKIIMTAQLKNNLSNEPIIQKEEKKGITQRDLQQICSAQSMANYNDQQLNLDESKIQEITYQGNSQVLNLQIISYVQPQIKYLFKYQVIMQEIAQFKQILFFVQLYRLLNKFLVNTHAQKLNFEYINNTKQQIKQPQQENYECKYQNFLFYLHKKQIQKQLCSNNQQLIIEKIIQFARLILIQIQQKIKQKSIKYEIESQEWLKQKKLTSLLFEYKQNLFLQEQNHSSFLKDANIAKKQMSLKSKSKSSRSQSHSSSNKSKTQINIEKNTSFCLKQIMRISFQLLKILETHLTTYSDTQYNKKNSQISIQINQNQNQPENDRTLQQVNKMAAIGNILTVIYIQSKRLQKVNKSIEDQNSSKNQIKNREVSKTKESLIKNQKQIQSFLAIQSKQLCSLDLFFQNMYEIQLQLLHSTQEDGSKS